MRLEFYEIQNDVYIWKMKIQIFKKYHDAKKKKKKS